MLITNLISRYMQLCKAAFSAGDGLKLNKSIQINVMEMLFLLMVILIFFYRRVNQQVQNYNTRLKNSCFGVEKFNFSLGLSFNFFCIEIILLSV